MLPHLPTAVQVLRSTLARFRARRAAYVAGSAALHAPVFGLAALGRALDHVLYPGHRRQPVDAPVFIVATPRCGTSLLHRLLGLDSRRFTHLKLYQTIFPSISILRAIDGLAAVDRALGALAARVVGAIDRNSFSVWDTIHPITLNQQEEDEAYFVLALLSPTLFLIVPSVEALPRARRADSLDARRRSRLARYYRGCLRRHLFAEGGQRTMLIKNVFHAGRLELLREAFPDARIVHLVRHPHEAIASALSLFHTVWRLHSPDIAASPQPVRALAEMFCDDYMRLHQAAQERGDPSRFLTVRYEDLTEQPRETVESIYAAFGYTMSPEYGDILRHATDESRRFRSGHRYALEDFGISRAELRDRLGPCFAAYGYADDGSTITKSAR